MEEKKKSGGIIISVCVALILFFLTMGLVHMFGSKIKIYSTGNERFQETFTLQAGSEILIPVHRSYMDTNGDGKPETERMEYSISFTKESNGGRVYWSIEGDGAPFGDDSNHHTDFVIGAYRGYWVPGTGGDNWDTYYVRIVNIGESPFTGTLTTTGLRRIIFNKKTKAETPMSYTQPRSIKKQ